MGHEALYATVATVLPLLMLAYFVGTQSPADAATRRQPSIRVPLLLLAVYGLELLALVALATDIDSRPLRATLLAGSALTLCLVGWEPVSVYRNKLRVRWHRVAVSIGFAVVSITSAAGVVLTIFLR